jgi:hypothetical protein
MNSSICSDSSLANFLVALMIPLYLFSKWSPYSFVTPGLPDLASIPALIPFLLKSLAAAGL